MLRVETHLITRKNKLSRLWGEADQATFDAKNLKNKTIYSRNSYREQTGNYLGLVSTDRTLQATPEYRRLPAKVAQCLVKQIVQDENSYWKALIAWHKDPSGFTGKPQRPQYLERDGRATLTFNMQAISRTAFRKDGLIKLSGYDIAVQTRIKDWESIKEVRLVPQTSCYKIEVVYSTAVVKAVESVSGQPRRIAVADPGVDNLLGIVILEATPVGLYRLVSSVLVSGRKLKSINQYANKRLAETKSDLMKHNRERKVVEITRDGQRRYSCEIRPKHKSLRTKEILLKRSNRLSAELHRISAGLIEALRRAGVDTLIIGKNPQWKQSCNMGKANNQKFMAIPHAKLIDLLRYKGEACGIDVVTVEESYSSKASAIEGDALPVYDAKTSGTYKFSGMRKGRGLYRLGSGILINADINGALNIGRKWLWLESKPEGTTDVVPKGLGGLDEVNLVLCSSPVRVEVLPDETVWPGIYKALTLSW